MTERRHPEFADLERGIEELGISLGTPLTYFARTDSTNTRAKEAARDGAPHGALFLAEDQDGGRGRQGRTWISPPGENLLLSMVLRFPAPRSRLGAMPIVVGLAVAETVATVVAAPDDVQMKWPNDVLLCGKKVAGILVEAIGPVREPLLVVGVGLNVHTREFPKDLPATSLSLHTAAPPHRGSVLLSLLRALDRDLFLAAGRGLGAFRARVEALDALRGKVVQSDAGEGGIARGIDEEGRLMVERPSGTLERWSAGEVHLVR